MKARKNVLLKIVLAIIGILVYCEFLIYYVVIFQCDWPELQNAAESTDKPVYAMFLADTHLLGRRNGHWFDKLRREWQMHRAFQTALTLHRPQYIFILGDVFDEGLWGTGIHFNEYVDRYHSLFAVPEETKLYAIVGNHDIGLHYKITPYLASRFEKQMNSPPVQMLSIRNNHFIMINSMAMEGDGCFLCSTAETALMNITSILRCTKGIGNCQNVNPLPVYSRPILLQHFPLYRISDEMCTESDAAPIEERSERIRERWDCLSRESTEFLIDNVQPRLALGGHTHHSCYIQHKLNHDDSFLEYSIPSFSWRNRNDPSFLLGVFTPSDFKIQKCKMPKENTVILTYICLSTVLLVYIIFAVKRTYKSKYYKRF